MVPRDVIHYHQILIHSEQSFQTMDGRNNNNNVILINSLFTMNFIQYKNLLSTKEILRPQLSVDKTITVIKSLCENSVFSPLFPRYVWRQPGGSSPHCC